MVSLIQENLLYNPDNNRYAIYRLLSNTNSSDKLQWGVVSRSGILNSDDTIRAGLVSGKKYDTKEIAKKRFNVLLESSIRRGFITYNYHVKYSYSQDWNDMIHNLEKRKTKKHTRSIKNSEKSLQNGDRYILEIKL